MVNINDPAKGANMSKGFQYDDDDMSDGDFSDYSFENDSLYDDDEGPSDDYIDDIDDNSLNGFDEESYD